jgi:hypothetical protein
MAVNDDRDLDAMFRALADSTRRVILDELANETTSRCSRFAFALWKATA